MKLVYTDRYKVRRHHQEPRFMQGEEVRTGDIVLREDGNLNVHSVERPRHSGSSGRVYTTACPNVDKESPFGYYPSVIGAEWVEREDEAPEDPDWKVMGELREKIKASMKAQYHHLRQTNSHADARAQMDYDYQLMMREIKAGYDDK